MKDLATRNGIDPVTERENVTKAGDAVGAEVSRDQMPARELPGVRPAAEWDESLPYLPTLPQSDSYFLNKYCRQTDRFWSCGGTPNLICVGSTRWSGSGVNMVQSGVRSGEGSHLYSVKYGVESAFDLTITPGTVWGWRRTSGTDRSPYSKVVHGGTGWYRHCVNFHF